MSVFRCFREGKSIVVMTDDYLNIVSVLKDVFDDADRLDLVSFESLLEILEELKEFNLKKEKDGMIIFKLNRDEEGFYTTSFLCKNKV